jgi:penicillin G amidase
LRALRRSSTLNFYFHLGAFLRAIRRFLLWIFAILLVVVGALAWWYVYRPLPQLDGTISLAGLQKEVTVDRDNWGIPHIRASSVEDLAEAQGYVMAQDRLWQMDLLRRVGRGQLSEILGTRTLSIDKQFRTLGFGHAADRDLTLMDKDSRAIMEAYARGANRFIEQHANNLPLEFSLLRYKPQPWQPTDSLVISGYMYNTLTSTWERKLDRAIVTEHVGPDRAKDLFSEESSMDHFIVGDPNNPNDGSQNSQANADDEDDDDDDMEPDAVLKASQSSPATTAAPEQFADLTSALSDSLQYFLKESQTELRQGLGSNNWVVSGAHTATGKPILANDTHLELSLPPIWYQVHLTAPGWNLKGFTLPGAPLIIIGHNDRIAWGFTNNGADVQDLYIETFNPASPTEYRANGKWIKAEVLDEVIHVKGQTDVHLPIVITRHGPLVYPGGKPGAILTTPNDTRTPAELRREAFTGYALRWTALEPGGLANTYNWLGKARNWHEFREIMKRVWGPAQNVVYADVGGNIGYIMAARVPTRKKGHGEVPVPGDTDDYEWTGYIPFDQLPQALNPDSGFIATANARVVGPNYKRYLTDRWEEPYRTARIYDLLHDKTNRRPIDMLKVETDTYSYPHAFLADQLSAAAKVVQLKDPRAQKLVHDAKDWNGIADADCPIVSFLVEARRSALEIILEPYLGHENYSWRSTAFLQRILTDRPPNWLPPSYKSYDELLAAAADKAVENLAQQSGSARTQDWPWKRFNSLEILHPIGREGALKWFLSISDMPQSGTSYSPRAASPHHGPSMRFIANLADWDSSIQLMPGGESGQLGSGHYTDQFSYWYEGKPIASPFSDAAESKARKHTLMLKPAP